MDILIIDDEPLILEALSDFLENQLGHRVTQCNNGQDSLQVFKENSFPMVLSDIRMPGMNGIELLKNLKDLPSGQNTDVVILTGHGDMTTAIEALRAGAYDYLLKPVDVEELAVIVDRIVEHQSQIQDSPHSFKENVSETTQKTPLPINLSKTSYVEISGVGKIGIFSDEMRTVTALANRLHDDRSVPVLIEGETGTGKEIVAKMVHYGNGDVNTPFISINCSAISPSLFESELFGYESGAFTGARKEGMKGKLELAKGGTLFLDEIGDLPLEMQPKLLRALQEREVYRVGGSQKIKLDVRIICATNRNLAQLVEEGSFRQDLFYRLNIGRIFLPPLSKRKEAIAPFAQMFLVCFAEEKKRRFRFLTKEAVKILENHSWPGNVRELQNTIERVVLLYDDIELLPEHLQFLTSKESTAQNQMGTVLKLGSIVLPPGKLNFDKLDTEITRKALSMFDGNKSKTAAYLGITRSALRSKLKKIL